MKSQINLLHDEFKPKFEWLSGSHFISINVLVLILCAAAYGATSYWLHSKEIRVASLSRQIELQQRQMEDITEALTSRETDPLLEAKLVNLREQNRDRGTLLQGVKGLSELKQRSFSSLFTSLSQVNIDELWISSFTVSQLEMHISGKVSVPNALPQWINQLNRTEFFAGQEFNLATIAREQNNLVFGLTNSKDKTVEEEVSPKLVKAEVLNVLK